VYLLHTYIYYMCVYLATAVRVTKVSLVNCPEMTIKRSGPVGLWALGDPFGGNVYGSPQAAPPVRLLYSAASRIKLPRIRTVREEYRTYKKSPHCSLHHKRIALARTHTHPPTHQPSVQLSLFPLSSFTPVTNIDKLPLYGT